MHPAVPTPSWAAQVQAAAASALQKAVAVETAAQNGDFDGEDGEDGVSPTVAVADIPGGHRVTITDAAHPTGQTFDVMDGGGTAGDGLTEDIKQALLQIAQKVAYIDAHGSDYYQDLYDALYPSTPIELTSITATFAQGTNVIYDTDSLNDLKPYLLVTANYSDSSSATVTNYTLSGTLTAGASTITVAYQGETDTFTVNVTHEAGVYTVTNNLTGATNSNSATSVTEGGSYSGTIAANAGYTLTGATVSITMGGTDITSTAYSNGTISIANVTGNISISVSAVQVVVASISASYTQSGTVYDTDSLDSLKSDLVVTATYSDSTTATVPSTDYTLSGTLTDGTSTITVSYGGKTATFNVTVTKDTSLWNFTNGYSLSKGQSGTQLRKVWRASTAARACGPAPIANNGYTFTVTDPSKYQLAAYDITSNVPEETTYSGVVDGIWYQGDTKGISWKTTDSVTTEYVWLALKKQDGTAFTDEELANGAEAVFTYTTT